MSYCASCGHELAADARFCAFCGSPANGAPQSAAAASATVSPVASVTGANSVMLASLGACAPDTAASLIARLCGYSAADAAALVSAAPVLVAERLTADQASCLARALAEYGLEVTVYDGSGYRSLAWDGTSVLDRGGSLLASAASILGLIGIGNRITRDRMRPQRYPYSFAGDRPPLFWSCPENRRFGMPEPAPRMEAPDVFPRMNRPERHSPDDFRGPGSERGMGGPGGGRGMGGPGGGRGMGGPGGERGMGGPGGERGMGGPGGERGMGGPGGERGMGGPGGR